MSVGKSSADRDGRSAGALGRVLLRRAGQLLAVTVAVTVLTFGLVHLIPGDPARTILGVHATPENLAALRAELGVDQPVWRQFGEFVSALARGDLGTSIATGRPVTGMLVPAFQVTFVVLLAALGLALVAGLALGLLGALAGMSWVDRTIRVTGMVLLATPTFLLGLMLILLFAVRLGVLPAGGWPTDVPGQVRSVLLPATALAGMQAPLIARAVRAAVLETVSQPYVTAAVTRGIGRWRILASCVLPNSLLPVVTVVGYTMAGLVGGSAVIEAVFALPGIGSLLVNSVAARDYPVIQGVALAVAVFVVLISFVTDVVYALIDPRTRLAAG